MEKAVVSGGAGFIGSYLCESLLADGYSVICIDNLSSGSKANIQSLLRDKNFTFLRHDVRTPIKGVEASHIFHLASRASPVDFSRYPTELLMTNALGTYNLLLAAKEGNAKFLLASTSEAYGDPLEHPQKETYWGNVNSIGPRSCYDEAKRFAEALTMAFLREQGVDARIVRIFNTYGPRMRRDDGRVIPNFITQALSNQPITVYGKGAQTRSFCYVTDLVDGIKKAMFSGHTRGEVFNLGDTRELSVLDAAKLVKRLAESSSEIIFKELPADDPSRRNPDISKARSLLGWSPKTSFEEGLKKTTAYFRELPDN